MTMTDETTAERWAVAPAGLLEVGDRLRVKDAPELTPAAMLDRIGRCAYSGRVDDGATRVYGTDHYMVRDDHGELWRRLADKYLPGLAGRDEVAGFVDGRKMGESTYPSSVPALWGGAWSAERCEVRPLEVHGAPVLTGRKDAGPVRTFCSERGGVIGLDAEYLEVIELAAARLMIGVRFVPGTGRLTFWAQIVDGHATYTKPVTIELTYTPVQYRRQDDGTTVKPDPVTVRLGLIMPVRL